jgi:3-deoxy-D-manno-octulosonate 8-phosphate phosphatase (KDO 8-P phosphatase)
MVDRKALQKIKVLAMEVDGILTDGQTWQNSDGVWERRFSVRDSLALKALRKSGYEIVLLTTFAEPSVETHFRAADVQHFFSDCQDRRAALEGFMSQHGFKSEECGYVSQNIKDLELIKSFGFSATVVNAPAPIKKVVHFICGKEGGDGAIRDLSHVILSGGFYSVPDWQIKKAINT